MAARESYSKEQVTGNYSSEEEPRSGQLLMSVIQTDLGCVWGVGGWGWGIAVQ